MARLHLITDTRPDRDTLAVVAAALRAGQDAGAPADVAIQVRVEDDVTDRQAYELTLRVAQMCRQAGGSCLVNDRLHIALATGSDGGHVGADDLPVAAARAILGPDAVLGGTARIPDTARQHLADGASYLGVGPLSASPTKDGIGPPIGLAGVAAVVNAAPLPVVAIGGVTVDQVAELRAAGAHGVAVISAIHRAADPYAETLRFLRALGGGVGSHHSSVAEGETR
ncbi:MAG: thiamine phosphate synthase [Micromonosporaceae bacterium]